MLSVLRQPEENRWTEGGKEEFLLYHLRKGEELGAHPGCKLRRGNTVYPNYLEGHHYEVSKNLR